MLCIYSFPWGMLGIALTGVGFVAAVEQTGGDRFTRSVKSLFSPVLGLFSPFFEPEEGR